MQKEIKSSIDTVTFMCVEYHTQFNELQKKKDAMSNDMYTEELNKIKKEHYRRMKIHIKGISKLMKD